MLKLIVYLAFMLSKTEVVLLYYLFNIYFDFSKTQNCISLAVSPLANFRWPVTTGTSYPLRQYFLQKKPAAK